jgi:hypothetical protein
MDLDDDDALQPEYVPVKPPTQLSADVVQCHKHHNGLAVVNGTSGMEIDREASFGDIEKILQGFFPDLFDWFDGLPKVEANAGDVGEPKHLPQWLLCTKLPGRSSGVSVATGVAFPGGSDIDFNVQIKCSGFRENILILSKCLGDFVLSFMS